MLLAGVEDSEGIRDSCDSCDRSVREWCVEMPAVGERDLECRSFRDEDNCEDDESRLDELERDGRKDEKDLEERFRGEEE